MNLQEIDLDRNLVIPLPEGFTKVQLATISAIYSGYKDKIDDYKNLVFNGTMADFNILVADRINGLTYWIIDISPLTNDQFKIDYQLLDKIDNPESVIDFGIKKSIVPIGNYMREAIKYVQTKEEQVLLNEKTELVVANLVVLDDIKAM